MKWQILIQLLVFQSVSSLTSSPPFPIFGPCQRRCIKKFGEIIERLSNTETIYNEVDVQNKTEFSLCKLGCNSPEYADLHLPAFRYGQSAYQEILENSDGSSSHSDVVKDANILCLDNNPKAKNDSSKRVLSGKVSLVLDEHVSALDFVYFIEMVARNADSLDFEETNIVLQDWCYSSHCNVTFFVPSVIENLQLRLRVSTFGENGPVGGVVLSKWYSINDILASSSIDLQVVNLEWNNDKAAAKLSIGQSGSISLPVCTMEVLYKTPLSTEFKRHLFNLDHTRQILLKRLEFNHSYTIKLQPAELLLQNGAVLGTASVDVPTCRQMVNDLSMCAPPPVAELSSTWNTSANNGYGLILTWTYATDLRNVSITETNSKIAMSHFTFILTPLITPNNQKCEKIEAVRRDVTWTHRKVIFYVPDAECNYEVEVFAFDSKQRRSDSKKIKILRINEPSYMSLLLAKDIPLSVGFLVIAISSVFILGFLVVLFLHKRKHVPKKMQELTYDTAPTRLVYAFVDANDSSRTVIGVRPLSLKFGSENSVNRTGGRTYTYNINEQSKRIFNQNELQPYLQYPSNQSSQRVNRINGVDNNGAISNGDEDHPYETITDFHVDSDISDDVFEEDRIHSTDDSINAITRRVTIPMAPIAPLEHFPDLPAFMFQDFQLTKTYEPEGNPPWRLTNVVDLLRGGSFGLKYGSDYSNEVRCAMERELRLLSQFPYHQHCVRFDGVVIGKWDNMPYQIVGLLMENCRGGSLRRYIHSVGSVLRRHAICTPNSTHSQTLQVTPNARNETSPSPPSSGYDSLKGNEKMMELNLECSAAHISIRFCQFAEQISCALEHLHRAGIVHTRITTISIYLYRDYNDPLDMLCDQFVKLGDFGNAATSAEEVVVDQNLQPPEVCLGKRYEAKGDVWQFGTCLVEMVSLGLPYQVQKEIPLSGIEEFDKLPSSMVLQEAAKKCLNPRHRPSASDLRAVFQTDSVREMRLMNMANLEKINQSLLV